MSTRIIVGDCRAVLATLPAESVQCVVTSPPYWGLRDYGVAGQLGLEPTLEEYVATMVEVFEGVRLVLKPDGVLWLNLGDSYTSTAQGTFNAPERIAGGHERQSEGNLARARYRPFTGLKPKDLCGIPWRVAFALQAAGWWLRQDIIWSKPNPMPESVTDRCTKAHEYIFMLTKSARYFFDAEAIKEPAIHEGRVVKASGSEAKNAGKGQFGATAAGFTSHDTIVTDRNKRSVWEIATAPFSEAHFATFPPALVEPCIRAGSKEGDTILDPFGGAGTVGLVADRLKRNAILIELNPAYAAMAERRIHDDAPLFTEVTAA